jgi:hypothetical protein
MNKHLTEGELRASLDNELDRDQFHHLEICAECQAQQRTMQAEHARIANRLAFLAPDNEPVPSVISATVMTLRKSLHAFLIRLSSFGDKFHCFIFHRSIKL